MPAEQWQILAVLGELYQQQGDEHEAHDAFAHATEIVQSFAKTLEDEQQRTTFLSAEPVRRVRNTLFPVSES